MEVSAIVSILSLITAMTVAVIGFLHNGRQEVERFQKLNDSVDSIATGVDELKSTVNRMDAKLDKHDGAIIRLETRLDEQDKRIGKLEGRCERHFGTSTHSD